MSQTTADMLDELLADWIAQVERCHADRATHPGGGVGVCWYHQAIGDVIEALTPVMRGADWT